MKRLLCGFLIIYVSMVTTAYSEMTYQELQHSYGSLEGRGNQGLDSYLIGVYEGINATNLAYYMQTKQFLFCMPQGLDLNIEDLRNILSESHETFDKHGEIPVSYLLFIGLRQTFPCL